MSERQYALVHGSEILTDKDGTPVVTPFLTDPPEGHSGLFPEDSRWLPIENVDTQPFELHQHWRDVPKYEVRGDQVARVYEVRHIGQAAK